MKKIASFITAALLFAVFITAVHFCFTDRIDLKSAEMGPWNNIYKYASNQAVTENLDKHTMPLFGSSEFNHGVHTRFHPKAVFSDQQLTPMLIGSAFSQSMTHAIALASIEQHMKVRKAVIIVSPTWFDRAGVKPQEFALRFSCSDYAAMLKNRDLSKGLRAKMASRSVGLLSSEKFTQDCAKEYNKVYLEKKGGLADKLFCRAYSSFVTEKDRANVAAAMKLSRIRSGAKKNISGREPDWQNLKRASRIFSEKESAGSRFYMYNKPFREKFRSKMKKSRFKDIRRSFSVSKEYDDLEIFLEVCRQSRIKPMIVILPINGYWYDYTGLPHDSLHKCAQHLHRLADSYDAEVADFTGRSHTPYFMQDAVHLSGEGWISIDESIDEFYKEGRCSGR